MSESQDSSETEKKWRVMLTLNVSHLAYVELRLLAVKRCPSVRLSSVCHMPVLCWNA